MPELLTLEATVALWGLRLGAQLWHYRRVYPGYDPAYLMGASPPPTDARARRATEIEAKAIWEREGRPDGCAERHWRTAETRVLQELQTALRPPGTPRPIPSERA